MPAQQRDGGWSSGPCGFSWTLEPSTLTQGESAWCSLVPWLEALGGSHHPSSGATCFPRTLRALCGTSPWPSGYLLGTPLHLCFDFIESLLFLVLCLSSSPSLWVSPPLSLSSCFSLSLYSSLCHCVLALIRVSPNHLASVSNLLCFLLPVSLPLSFYFFLSLSFAVSFPSSVSVSHHFPLSLCLSVNLCAYLSFFLSSLSLSWTVWQCTA